MSNFVELIDDRDLPSYFKIGDKYENCDRNGGVTINNHGWWTFPTWHRWRAVRPEEILKPDEITELVKVLYLIKRHFPEDIINDQMGEDAGPVLKAIKKYCK